MTLLAALWAGLAVTDLVRWSPGRVPPGRRTAALAAAAATGLALAALLLDLTTSSVLVPVLVLLVTTASALAWVATTSRTVRPKGAAGGIAGGAAGAPARPLAPVVPLALVAGAHAAALLAAPLAGGVPDGSPLARWWGALAGAGLPQLAGVSPTQALLALTGALLLLGTGNRVVRLVLAASGTSPDAGEASLRGGRLLGPLERLFLLVLALAGDLTAAAAVIAAKGLLRLPEVRTASRLVLAGRLDPSGAPPGSSSGLSSAGQHDPPAPPAGRGLRGPDEVTEYFLVGTFTSWLLALGVAGAVALAGG